MSASASDRWAASAFLCVPPSFWTAELVFSGGGTYRPPSLCAGCGEAHGPGPPARCEENRPCGRHARRGGLRESAFRRSAAVRELRLVFARLPAASISAVGRTGRKKPEAEAGVHPGKGHRRNGAGAALRLLRVQVGATGHRVRGRAVRPPRKIGPAAVAVRRSGGKDRFGSRNEACSAGIGRGGLRDCVVCGGTSVADEKDGSRMNGSPPPRPQRPAVRVFVRRFGTVSGGRLPHPVRRLMPCGRRKRAVPFRAGSVCCDLMDRRRFAAFLCCLRPCCAGDRGSVRVRCGYDAASSSLQIRVFRRYRTTVSFIFLINFYIFLRMICGLKKIMPMIRDF